jgi:L-cysteine S-thiosulfotransferase
MKMRWMVASAVALIAGCATVSDTSLSERAREVMRHSFKEQGQAKLDRLDQDEVQAYCSRVASGAVTLSNEVAGKIEKSQQATIAYPADGKLIGDWREGEKIAQSGVGKQYSDDPKGTAGGNCYACHQLTKEEVSYGTLGPSLNGYGKLRGQSVDMQRYTYGKIYNPQAYTACSNMPRFGHNGILTAQQLRDVVALLLDPQSPVNR